MTAAHERDREVTVSDAVVPADVAERLAELEDEYWSTRAAEVLERNEPTIPWDTAVALLESGDADA